MAVGYRGALGVSDIKIYVIFMQPEALFGRKRVLSSISYDIIFVERRGMTERSVYLGTNVVLLTELKDVDSTQVLNSFTKSQRVLYSNSPLRNIECKI